jgi:peptide subunit release factor 1 (eRF1)
MPPRVGNRNQVVPITWQLVRTLASVRTRVGRAVSLYVELDPRTTPTWRDVETRVTSLLHQLRVEREGLRAEDRASLDEDVERIERFIELEHDREGVRGMCVFAAAAAGLWEAVPLSVPSHDAVHLDRELYLVPLVPLVPLSEPALVAVVNRRRGSLYRVENGAVEELADLTDPDVPTRHDQGGWSQANYERHADELARRHMEKVAAEIDRRVRLANHTALILVCPEDERSEVQSLLAPDVKAAVVGWTSVEAHAGAAAVARAVQPVLARQRALREERAIARWQAERRGTDGGAAGWAAVLSAASDGRVEELLYQPRAKATAYRCTDCGRGAIENETCPVDGAAVEPVDALNLALVRTLGHGGTALAIEDGAALGGEDACARVRW